MFFTLSKVLWFLTAPANLLLIGLAVGMALLWSPWRRAGRAVTTFCVIAAMIVAVAPIGQWGLALLENRFPPVSELPARVDGIVVAGGVVSPRLSVARGQVSIGGAVERLTAMAELADRYPNAKLIYSAGSGDILHPELKEAHFVAPVLARMGLDSGRLILEDQARNTFENAVNCFRLVEPKPDETWLLVTSAFHMPRAVGTFRQAGWSIIPYPVDYKTPGKDEFLLGFNLSTGLGYVGLALHEWLGLFFYWVTDKSDAIFPGPDS
jgi:uncharacterized SAM-binding protein YcdF (DUF218 family)